MHFIAIDVLFWKYIIPFETSLSISWGLGPGVTPTSYNISYHNTNTQCFNGSHDIFDIDISQTMYYLTGLEEGSEYTISINVQICEIEQILEEKISTSTLPNCQLHFATPCLFYNKINIFHAVSTAVPSSVRVSVESYSSVTVQWGPVKPCIDQNGAITGYSVRYGEVGTSERTVVEMVSGDSSGGMTTISGLTKETVYTVEVAAETSAGTGVYSGPAMFQTPVGECLACFLSNYEFITDIYLSLNGSVIPNHGYILISDIGFTDETALLCNANLSPSDDQSYSEGTWFTPNQTKIPEKDEGNQGFLSNRTDTSVRLKRYNSMDAPQDGIYSCEINNTSTNATLSVYVGLYHGSEGL